MPPVSRQALRVNDVVSVPATAFGQAWAKNKWTTDWHRKKIEGKVVGRAAAGGNWLLSFPDDDDASKPAWEISLPRKDINFISE